jgi:ribonuclease BN (tRNA processing enzyme)
VKITVLGCAGGVGGPHLRTTSLRVDDDILVDAGTGAVDLSLEDMAKIDHVLLTHAHLDHICALPLILDSVGAMRPKALTVHALPEVIEALRQHIFNHHIWPDFSRIPSAAAPYLVFSPLTLGQTLTLGQRRFTALPADHVVPACGYAMTSPGGQTLVFSGDTGPCPAFWQAVNQQAQVVALIIETAFPNAEHRLALAAKHLCPTQLAEELQQLRHPTPVYITHLKPGAADLTMQEVQQAVSAHAPLALSPGQQFLLD